MDPTLAREYRARWEAVSEVEQAEQQHATLEERWAKLNAILSMAVALGVDLGAGSDDEELVWQRWATLKAGKA
jgi:hypothetical protein